MPYRQALESAFPDAVPVDDYLGRVHSVVAPLRFTRDRTFAAVSICRDEMTQGFVAAVGRRWDPPFSLGGLGALPSLGRTGWRAALSHVPDADGRGCLLVFGMPHLGIDPDGVVGQSLRPFQQQPTPTCGAMTALLRSLSSGDEPLPPGLNDLEADRLRRVVDAQETAADLPRDLVALTELAVSAVDAEIWAELEALDAPADMDVAVFCGIQVHLPDLTDHIVGRTGAFQGPDGVRKTLDLPTG